MCPREFLTQFTIVLRWARSLLVEPSHFFGRRKRFKKEAGMYGAQIVGLGVALPGTNVPGTIVTNDQLATELLARRDDLLRRGKLRSPEQWATLPAARHEHHKRRWEQFETSDEWIFDHTGIRERRIADPGVATSDLAAVAGRMAMQVAGWSTEDVDCIIVATVLGDYQTTPPTVAIVQEKLGIPASDERGMREIEGFDVSCACSSVGKALKIGYTLIRAGMARRVLVIGADVMSRTVNIYSRSPYAILGDAGGAIALEMVEGDQDAFLGPQGFLSGLDGSLAELIITQYGGTRHPIDKSTVIVNPFHQGHRMLMVGPEVKKRAVRLLCGFLQQPGIIWQALIRAGIPLSAIKFLALHQANARINEPVVKKLVEHEEDPFVGVAYSNIERFGNTTSASIPLVLFDAWQDGALTPGDLVFQLVFGGGFSWATACYHWTLPRQELSLAA